MNALFVPNAGAKWRAASVFSPGSTFRAHSNGSWRGFQALSDGTPGRRMDTMSTTRTRVPDHTSGWVNERISRQTDERVRSYEHRPEKVKERLEELDREWDIERAIEANASALALIGVTLGVTRDRRWLALAGLVAAFLLQHAVQGWCPPVPILRRLGFRTSYEIEEERRALQAMRGDYERLPKGEGRARAALQIARTA
jgi:Protein of unknown function (DUF2892)